MIFSPNRQFYLSGGGVLLLFFILLFQIHRASAQPGNNYKPLRLYSGRSSSLMEQIENQLLSETIHAGSMTNDLWIRSVQGQKVTLLRRLLKAESFIKNDTLDSFVDGFLERIVSANDLPRKKRTILIMNDPEVNASCYGPGLFIVNVGLLARMSSEQEFAFILAHELAHDELEHGQQWLQRTARDRNARNPGKSFARILFTDVENEELDALRSSLYSHAALGRENELQADSLALVLMSTAGYPSNGAIQAIDMLSSANEPKHNHEDFFQAFQFANFPFKPYWLNERLSIYDHKPGNTFLFTYDSLISHPVLKNRKVIVEEYIQHASIDTVHINVHNSLSTVIWLAEFQTVEAAYRTKQYDQCLYQILQLYQLYRGNVYLTSRATKVMLDLFEAKNEMHPEIYAARYTRNYGQRLKDVNNFLFNISKEELAELAFQFLNNQANFNRAEKAHYYLLWKICEFTLRSQVSQKIALTYESTFQNRISLYKYQ